jgi:hypothetical protein
MWTWSLNWGEVTPHIVVGTCPMTPEDLGRLRARAAVTAVLSLQHDDCLDYWGIDYPAWEAYYGCREDLVARHHSLIERRACELGRRGVNGDPRRDWQQAEEEVLAAVLSGERP